MASEHARPDALTRDELPEAVRAQLEDDEEVLYYGQPIRRAGGIGVWMIMGLGVIFTVASVGALEEIVRRSLTAAPGVGQALLILVVGLATILFLAFSLMMLVWPWLSDRSRRLTHVVVTDHRVVRVLERANPRSPKGPRIKEWPVTSCDDAAVARRRGASATLVLRERVRERKSDGKTIYEWDALHGLPRADEALEALLWAREQKLAAIAAHSLT